MGRRDPILDRIFAQRLAVTRIAEACGISTAAVCQWRRVPDRHVAAVTKISRIPRYVLRPDLYRQPRARAAAE